MPTLTFRLVNFSDYLPLKLLLVWIILRFRSCSCLAFATCSAVASSSGAYSSNFSKSFTAPSFTDAVFSFRFSSLYKSPLSLARTLFCFSSSLFFILSAMISVSFFFPEKGIFFRSCGFVTFKQFSYGFFRGLRFFGFADFFFGGFRHLFRLESDRTQMLRRAAFLAAL